METHGYGRDKGATLSSSFPFQLLDGAQHVRRKLVRHTLPGFKKLIIPVLQEYFVSLDMEEVEKHLYEINAQSTIMSFETYDYDGDGPERSGQGSRVSAVVVFVWQSSVVHGPDWEGFERLFEVCDDLLIDVPDAQGAAAFVAALSLTKYCHQSSWSTDVQKLGGR